MSDFKEHQRYWKLSPEERRKEGWEEIKKECITKGHLYIHTRSSKWSIPVDQIDDEDWKMFGEAYVSQAATSVPDKFKKYRKLHST
jgi:hypothetical protein